MAKCLVPLSESTIGMIVALKSSPEESYDAVVRRVIDVFVANASAPRPTPCPTPPSEDELSDGNRSRFSPGGPGHKIRVIGTEIRERTLVGVLATVLNTLAKRDPGFLVLQLRLP